MSRPYVDYALLHLKVDQMMLCVLLRNAMLFIRCVVDMLCCERFVRVIICVSVWSRVCCHRQHTYKHIESNVTVPSYK